MKATTSPKRHLGRYLAHRDPLAPAIFSPQKFSSRPFPSCQDILACRKGSRPAAKSLAIIPYIYIYKAHLWIPSLAWFIEASACGTAWRGMTCVSFHRPASTMSLCVQGCKGSNRPVLRSGTKGFCQAGSGQVRSGQVRPGQVRSGQVSWVRLGLDLACIILWVWNIYISGL